MAEDQASINDEEKLLLSNLKDEFFKKYESNILNGEYDQRDLKRLKENNVWLYAFYKHAFEKYDAALSLIAEVLKWRVAIKANELLNEDNLPFTEELFKKGGVFFRNTDKNGTLMLHFVIRLHKKDQYSNEQVSKFIAYHFEKAYKFNWHDKITVVLDLAEAGISNLDMELIKFIVNCLKTYYPGLIGLMIIYQMPFIFNAAWKIIKNLLPSEALQLIKFVDKKNIKEYIDDEQLFIHMGGKDDYKYVYEGKEMYSEEALRKRVNFDQNPSILEQSNSSKIKKTQSEVLLKSDIIKNNSTESLKTTSTSAQNQKDEFYDENNNFHTENEQPFEAKQDQNAQQDNLMNGSILTISPNDAVVFQLNDNKTDALQTLTLTNSSELSVAYKIKITSPDKFRVKPGSGIINPKSSIQIAVNFLKDFHNVSINIREKFLILWAKIDESTKKTDLNEFWKQMSNNPRLINQHKIKCIISHANSENISKASNVKPETSSILKRNNQTKDGVAQAESNNNPNPNPFNNTKDGVNITDSCSVNKMLKEFKDLNLNVNETMKLQERLNRKFMLLIFLVYILLSINIIQLVFQSNVYNNIIEPYVHNILFQKD